MSTCCKIHWKLLTDKNTIIMDLLNATGVASATIARIPKDMPASTEVIMKNCKALYCNLGDIAGVTNDEETDVENHWNSKWAYSLDALE